MVDPQVYASDQPFLPGGGPYTGGMAVHSSRASVGSPAPKFALPDAEGTVVALDDLLARGPVVVVFLRGFA